MVEGILSSFHTLVYIYLLSSSRIWSFWYRSDWFPPFSLYFHRMTLISNFNLLYAFSRSLFYFYYQGIAFSDLMYVTKRSMANAVTSLTQNLEKVTEALNVNFHLPFNLVKLLSNYKSRSTKQMFNMRLLLSCLSSSHFFWYNNERISCKTIAGIFIFEQCHS